MWTISKQVETHQWPVGPASQNLMKPFPRLFPSFVIQTQKLRHIKLSHPTAWQKETGNSTHHIPSKSIKIHPFPGYKLTTTKDCYISYIHQTKNQSPNKQQKNSTHNKFRFTHLVTLELHDTKRRSTFITFLKVAIRTTASRKSNFSNCDISRPSQLDLRKRFGGWEVGWDKYLEFVRFPRTHGVRFP